MNCIDYGEFYDYNQEINDDDDNYQESNDEDDNDQESNDDIENNLNSNTNVLSDLQRVNETGKSFCYTHKDVSFQ